MHPKWDRCQPVAGVVSVECTLRYEARHRHIPPLSGALVKEHHA